MQNLSIIIPLLNEEENLKKQKESLELLIKQGHEVLVIDGGSNDNSTKIANQIGCRNITTYPSRGHQLHLGAVQSKNEILLFLHADTLLPPNAAELIFKSFERDNKHWGRFNIKFSSSSYVFSIIAWFMNLRSSLTGIVTGDHAVFVKKDSYIKCGGFPDWAIMEDIAISKRLKTLSHPVCLKEHVVTSSRKWEKQGIINTILLMWKLRLMFLFGMPAEKLAKLYY